MSAASHDVPGGTVKSSRRPTVKLSLTRDTSGPDDGDEEEGMDLEHSDVVRLHSVSC